MAGVRTRTIREGIHALMLSNGWAPSAYPFAAIGRDKGSKLHRSFATHCPQQLYDGRQQPGLQSRSRIEVRVLLSTQHDDPASVLDVDDAADDLVSLLLLEGAGQGWVLAIDSRTTAPHATLPRIHVVTVALTALHTTYTQDTP